MSTLLLQFAPQRSTQYASLVDVLAPIELKLSPIGKLISTLSTIQLGGQKYLKCELNQNPTDDQINELGLLATGSAYFLHYENIGDQPGPFLKPLEPFVSHVFPPDFITTRRYQGKTNELLTQFMLNIARYSSDFADQPWNKLRLFDPLAGGGTTLFAGLVLGAEVAGVEQNKKSAQSTATFLKQYTKEQNISVQFKEERVKKFNGTRWWFTFGDKQTRCILAKGELDQAPELLSGFKKPHFIIADLPYGIQHKGGLEDLLTTALPVWQDMLLPGGTLVFSWDATRSTREKMVDLVESSSQLTVLNEPPYNQMGHRVDRVIKNRDILTAKKVVS